MWIRHESALLWVAFVLGGMQTFASAQSDGGASVEVKPRDPLGMTLLPMDLDASAALLRRYDLDDNGELAEAEVKAIGWRDDPLPRFDLNRDHVLQPVELALLEADRRMDQGIVQMDSVLAKRYTQQYDKDRDGRLSLKELDGNTFTDQQEAFDKNSDGELSEAEFIRGLAFERTVRDALGIKGCDQGGAMKLIRRGDRDGNQTLSDDELVLAKLSDEAMKFDRNGNGELSVSELAECLAERRNRLGLTPKDQLAVRAMLQSADRDRNGSLSGDEVVSIGNQAVIKDADRNQDGEVTELELERLFGERRKELGFDDQDQARAMVLMERNDRDRSRTLSRAELVASGAGRESVLSPEKLVLIDTDKDGAASINELARFLHRMRSRSD